MSNKVNWFLIIDIRALSNLAILKLCQFLREHKFHFKKFWSICTSFLPMSAFVDKIVNFSRRWNFEQRFNNLSIKHLVRIVLLIMPTITLQKLCKGSNCLYLLRSDSWTYLPTYIPTYLLTYLPAYFHTCLLSYLPTFIPAYHIPTYLPTYSHTYLHTYIPTEMICNDLLGFGIVHQDW